MGYSHHFRIKKELDKETFKKFCQDSKKIVDFCENELGINIANGCGEPNTQAEIEDDFICLNGSDSQEVGKWTTEEQISIPWPSPLASIQEEKETQFDKKTEGKWLAGDLLSQRVAPIDNITGKGSGSYETLFIENEVGESFIKTAYRPYDLCVTAILIALKYYFKDSVLISSDGEEKDWFDGKVLCNNLLGFGFEFEIEDYND